jgi:hypothetical protein
MFIKCAKEDQKKPIGQGQKTKTINSKLLHKVYLSIFLAKKK